MVRTSTDERIAASIREAMTAQGVTEVTLADATTIPRATLRRRLKGGGSLKVAELELVCAHLGLDPAELLAGAAA
jgi:transcriptional regulator with XRE-family HTH domain